MSAHRGQPAQSLYRGLRVTYTQVPGADRALVIVAAKHERDRWDEWSQLFPALRLEASAPQSAREAVAALLSALQQAYDEMS